MSGPHVPPLDAVTALRIIAGARCASSTAGTGACFTDARIIGARYGADAVCDACLAWAALLPDHGGIPGDPVGHGRPR